MKKCSRTEKNNVRNLFQYNFGIYITIKRFDKIIIKSGQGISTDHLDIGMSHIFAMCAHRLFHATISGNREKVNEFSLKFIKYLKLCYYTSAVVCNLCASLMKSTEKMHGKGIHFDYFSWSKIFNAIKLFFFSYFSRFYNYFKS